MRPIGRALLLAFVILAVHTMHVWGYTGNFWGDIGRWSHEVERFALGELPYRDFQWHYPPLGLWVEGGLASVIGTDRLELSLITITLATLIVAAFVFFSRDVLGRVDSAVVAICIVLALAFAQTKGAALPFGLYSPAAIVGAVCIANAIRLFVRNLHAPARFDAEWVGLSAGLAVLSKQDYWIPAAFLVGAMVIRERRLAAAITSGATTVAGVLIIVVTAGTGVLLPLAGGFGHAQVAGGQGFPSWERITIDLFALSLVCGTYALLASIACRRVFAIPLLGAGALAILTGGLHVWMSMNTVLPGSAGLLTPTQDFLSFHIEAGNSLLRPAIGWLRERTGRTPLPLALPLVLLLLTALRWKQLTSPRRTVLAILLGLAVALRARRGFEGTEWIEFLFTLPILLASAETLFTVPELTQRRLRAATLGTLSLLAAWAYVAHGRGWGTSRYYPGTVVTLRGNVHWKPSEERDYRGVMAAIDSLDPSRVRPVFAYGFTGGWNYFLKRRNPYPFTQDFFFSAFDADSVLALPRPAGLVLIDNPFLARMSFAVATFDVRSWEQPRVSAPYDPYDRPRFDKLRAGCERVPVEGTAFPVYACP